MDCGIRDSLPHVEKIDAPDIRLRAMRKRPLPAGSISAQPLPAGSDFEPLEARLLLSCTTTGVPSLSNIGASIVMQPNLLYAAPADSLNANAASSADVQGNTPAQIKTAYGIDQVSFDGVQGDGTGQTIAIIDAYNDPNIAGDLKVFDAYFGLPAPPSLSIKSETGGSVAHLTTDAGWATEISLDVEWAHAIAPNANILLVEASSDNLNDLVAAVNYARGAPGVSVVSMSWGGDEFQGEATYDTIFSTPAGHNPVTFVTASGDTGAYYGPEWPATSDNVVSVGGTTLNLLDSAGDYGSEQAWQYSTGGTSLYEIEPRYQSHVQDTTYRDNPDVAYDADPNTGFAVYDSLAYEGYVGWQEIGGTSAGSPQWAALIAIADQGRANQGQPTLDSDLGTLPALYAIYNSSTTYSADFNDVASSGTGGFGRHHQSSSQQDATVGYDLTTGLGTPQVPALVNTLVNATNLPAKRTAVGRTPRPPGNAGPVVVRPNYRVDSSGAASSPAAPASNSITPAIASQTPVLSDELLPAAGSYPAKFSRNDIAGILAGPSGQALDAAQLATAAVSLIDSSISTPRDADSAGPVSATPIYFFKASDATQTAMPLAALFPDGSISGIASGQWTGELKGMFSGAGRLLAAGVNLLPSLGAARAVAASQLNIPTLGNVEVFADALTGFVNDSATVGPAGNMRYVRAWTVTAAVLAADAALVAHWYVKRRQEASPNKRAVTPIAAPDRWPFRAGI